MVEAIIDQSILTEAQDMQRRTLAQEIGEVRSPREHLDEIRKEEALRWLTLSGMRMQEVPIEEILAYKRVMGSENPYLGQR